MFNPNNLSMKALINSVNGINQKSTLPSLALWDAKSVVFALISACKIDISCLFCKETLLCFYKILKFRFNQRFLKFALCFLGLIFCSNAFASNDSEKKHLNFACYKYSDYIDPSVNVNSSWCGVRYGITECLFKFDENTIARPNLAEVIDISEDHKTWTIRLFENIKFSNGKPVTASAVVASFERLYKETDASQGGKGNSNPDGYLIYESLSANDQERTVTFKLKQPTNNLMGILSYPYFVIIDVNELEPHVIGTGPYAIQTDNMGVHMDLVKNEHYRTNVPFDTVSIFYVDDNTTKSIALQNGDVDVVENITSPDAIEEIAKNDGFYISTSAGVRTGNSYINFKNELGNDALRKAVIMALDTETMCNITVGGMYTSGFAVLPSSLPYNYDKLINPYPFNTEKAIKLLDDAKIIDTDGDGYRELNGQNINLNYIVYTSRNLNDFAQAVALQLEAIGIKTTVNIRDYDTALALQNAGEFDLVTANTMTVGVGDPQDFLGNWYSPNSVNYGYYKNEEYDKNYEALMVEFDLEKRIELITKLQQILIDDGANLVHGYYNSRMFSNKNKIDKAEIRAIDYYWLSTETLPHVISN